MQPHRTTDRAPQRGVRVPSTVDREHVRAVVIPITTAHDRRRHAENMRAAAAAMAEREPKS